ncbi:dATP/dGTP diphosphohydrolase domain-containing protein [Sphingomonas asaccharolytica]|uniref:dATP/dGTP diphosphohydrolase domain-containing protein n=1 Tax=Sphingomonas asaccharolytica TaxID=40681 RepID=UPI00082D08AE|nr:dATP/dGTP diphosphohydrolase domain-containing protein [Sphingomonas asaccharolytica]
MIDTTLPLELEDGTPAQFHHLSGEDLAVDLPPGTRERFGDPHVDHGTLFRSNGRPVYARRLPRLRNVAPAPIGHNGGPPLNELSLPDDDAKRGEYPMADGLLDYFPNALAEVSKVSKIGNDQHNPGEPMHWARDKSTDHPNKIMRHLVDRGKLDGRGVRHTARLAWRALALLQDELEAAEGLPRSRGSK